MVRLENVLDIILRTFHSTEPHSKLHLESNTFLVIIRKYKKLKIFLSIKIILNL